MSVAGVTNATQDNTLLRKCDVTQGNSDWNASAGTNIQNYKWFIKPQNYWLIRQHISPCLIPFIYGCTDPLASNYNSQVNTDDGTCLYSGCNGLATTSGVIMIQLASISEEV